MKYLTLVKVKSLGPCLNGLASFEELFGDKAEVTADNISRYIYSTYGSKHDISWLIEELVRTKAGSHEDRELLRKVFTEHMIKNHVGDLDHFWQATYMFKYLPFEIQAKGIQEILEYT